MVKGPVRISGDSMAMPLEDIQFISDADGKPTAVIVPIDLWREISSEKETAYLLQSETMKRRLLEAGQRKTGIPLAEVREKLGI
jgi:hypothetical protein